MHIIPGGKFAGSSIQDVDSGYLNWLLQKWDEMSYYKSWEHFITDYTREVILDELKSRGKPSAGFNNFTLSESQQVSANDIRDNLLDSGTTQIMRLSGGAGYGKTFVLKQVILDATERGYTCYATSTSFVASTVLEKGLMGSNMEIGTIARMIRLSPVRDGDKKEVYEITEASHDSVNHLLRTRALLIVDEFSMVGDEIANLMMQGAVDNGGKLLVVGDPKQLPSPSQDYPSILCRTPIYTELTTPMRYSEDSDLYAMEQVARHNPQRIPWDKFDGSKEIILYPGQDLNPIYDSYIDTMNNHEDHSTIMLFYRKKNVQVANDFIRLKLYGEDADIIMPNERMRVLSTYNYHDDAFPAYVDGDQEPILYSSQDPKLSRFYSGTQYTVDERFEYTTMRVQTFNHTGTTNDPVFDEEIPIVRGVITNIETDISHTVNILFAESESKGNSDTITGAAFNRALAALKKEAKELNEMGAKRPWSRFFAFKESFVWVAYSYATTVHRVQGMTCDNVFINYHELISSQPLNRDNLMYVALTRASKTLHIKR